MRLLIILACFAMTLNGYSTEDLRHKPLKDLNGYFPFDPPETLSEWEIRKARVRRQILVSAGLWPMPTKTPLNAVIHGRIDCKDYTVEKVYFESAPGFFVTGNLYRPKNIEGRVPGVLLAHGHWKDARLALSPEAKVRKLIASGAERFEGSGRNPHQCRSVQLARMGCVVWQWDMLGDSDSIQISRELAHRFKKQRPEMNTTENWGLFSPQAEAHLQNIMGLQTLNSIRSLDFLLTLPEVDPERVAMTGGSGGGTQTMILAAIDERIKLSFPVVMVSTSMQGGCPCENASLLRVNMGNVEFAGLFAPRPQGMNSANDWTREMATKGFPELEKLYALYGAEKNVFLLRGEHFPHNYNAVTRSAVYTFLNRHFKLGQTSPVIEQDFELLTAEELTVWGGSHPQPKAADPDFERALLKWFTDDAEKQLRAQAATAEGLQTSILPGLEAMIGRTYADAGSVEWAPGEREERDSYFETAGTLRNTSYGEQLNTLWLSPKQWDGHHAVVWLGDHGRAALRSTNGDLVPAVAKLIQEGVAVLGADLLFQGEDLVSKTRVVDNPREFAGYTFGYNHTLFAQRTHDVLTLVNFLRNGKSSAFKQPETISVAGWGRAAPIVVAARALAGAAIDRAAVDTQGFRFGNLLDYRDPMFIPGGAKYLDMPGLLALNAPHALWLAGECEDELASITTPAYRTALKPEKLTLFQGDAAQKKITAVAWLLKK